MIKVEVNECKDPSKRIPFRIFAILGLLHWVSGLVFVVLGLIVYWTYAILPAVWFCVGFLWIDAAHLMVTDYRYEYRDGTMTIYKVKFGVKRKIATIPLDRCSFEAREKCLKCTNDPPNLWLNLNTEKSYALTVSPYLAALCKGEIDVS